MSKIKASYTLFLLLILLHFSCHTNQHAQTGMNDQIRAMTEEKGFSLTWEDDFDTFNEENWTIGLRDQETGDLVPGAHGDFLLNDSYDAYFTQEDVYIGEGSLILRNQRRPFRGISPEGDFAYTSGWVMSMHKVFFKEGYLETRAQFPRGDKVWPAIWLIPEDLTWCPEWDLFEYFGYRKDLGFDQMGMHLCYTSWPDQQWDDYFIQDFDQKYHGEEWHTYGFAWTTEYAAWYIDGKEVRRLSSQGIADWPDKNMYIVLNNGTRTESPDENTDWPNYLRIDYIRLYTRQISG